jgi:beta-glucanase (GH16 family)
MGGLCITASAATTARVPVVDRHCEKSSCSRPPSGVQRLVFDEEFSGPTLNRTNWSPYFSPGNGGNGLRRPTAFRIDKRGWLVVTATTVDGEVVSGGMALKHDYTYGYYEFRVRTEPDSTGITNAVVLTWPQSGRWPGDGEIDMYEAGIATSGRRTFDSFVHYDSTNKQYAFEHRVDPSQWHVVAMLWAQDRITIYRDGRAVWTLRDQAAIPRVAHHVCVQLDLMRSRTLNRPVRMYVDYVRIWQP